VEPHPASDLRRRAPLFRRFNDRSFPGFFMQLLGSGMRGTGGAAAYLILSHRSQVRTELK